MTASDQTDRILIRELIDKYCDIINVRDFAAYGDLWTEDAVFEALTPFNRRAEGRDEIVRVAQSGNAETDFLAQMCHAFVIDEINGDTARSHSTLHIIAHAENGTGYSAIGIYRDELKRTADGWRFTKRSFQPAWIDPTSPGGKVLHYFGRETPDAS